MEYELECFGTRVTQNGMLNSISILIQILEVQLNW